MVASLPGPGSSHLVADWSFLRLVLVLSLSQVCETSPLTHTAHSTFWVNTLHYFLRCYRRLGHDNPSLPIPGGSGVARSLHLSVEHFSHPLFLSLALRGGKHKQTQGLDLHLSLIALRYALSVKAVPVTAGCNHQGRTPIIIFTIEVRPCEIFNPIWSVGSLRSLKYFF